MTGVACQAVLAGTAARRFAAGEIDGLIDTKEIQRQLAWASSETEVKKVVLYAVTVGVLVLLLVSFVGVVELRMLAAFGLNLSGDSFRASVHTSGLSIVFSGGLLAGGIGPAPTG